MDVPETLYAKTIDGLSIAYQVLGQGSIDLVCTKAWISSGFTRGRWRTRTSDRSLVRRVLYL
jgi:hypothetical protein